MLFLEKASLFRSLPESLRHQKVDPTLPAETIRRDIFSASPEAIAQISAKGSRWVHVCLTCPTDFVFVVAQRRKLHPLLGAAW